MSWPDPHRAQARKSTNICCPRGIRDHGTKGGLTHRVQVLHDPLRGAAPLRVVPRGHVVLLQRPGPLLGPHGRLGAARAAAARHPVRVGPQPPEVLLLRQYRLPRLVEVHLQVRVAAPAPVPAVRVCVGAGASGRGQGERGKCVYAHVHVGGPSPRALAARSSRSRSSTLGDLHMASTVCSVCAAQAQQAAMFGTTLAPLLPTPCSETALRERFVHMALLSRLRAPLPSPPPPHTHTPSPPPSPGCGIKVQQARVRHQRQPYAAHQLPQLWRRPQPLHQHIRLGLRPQWASIRAGG